MIEKRKRRGDIDHKIGVYEDTLEISDDENQFYIWNFNVTKFVTYEKLKTSHIHNPNKTILLSEWFDLKTHSYTKSVALLWLVVHPWKNVQHNIVFELTVPTQGGVM